MKIFGLWTLLTAFFYVLQTSLLPIFAYNGISTNFMLLLTVSTAFLLGSKKGIFMGFAAGLLQDLTTGSFFGCSIFSYMLLGLMCGKFATHVFREQFPVPVLTSIPAAAFHYGVMLAFVLMFGYRIDLKFGAEHVLLPMCIYQFIFAYPVHKIVYNFDKKTRRSDRR